jgi:hypothetical protein
MSRSDLPQGPEVPESTVSELHALYREAAQAEPDATLDRKVLDAARAELRAAGATKARRQPPWWKGWLPAASALAVALVGLSVTWRVMDQQERDLRQEMQAAEAVRERSPGAAGSVVPAKGAAETSPSPRAPAPVAEKDRRAESTALKDAPAGVPEPAAMPAPATPAPMAPMAPLAPTVADEALKKSGRAEKEDLRERRDASAAMDAASRPARQAGKLEAGRLGAVSGGEAAADSLAGPSANPAAKSAVGSVSLPPPDAATPEAWLKQIRELRTAGRSPEAAQSLVRFRARYPDFVVPEDLLKLK